MNIQKFTQKSLDAVNSLEKITYDFGNQEIAQIQLLYALLTQEDGYVMEYMLDNNGHINNGQFVRLGMSYMPTDRGFTWLRVEYKKQARLGDVLRPVRFSDDDRDVVVLKNGADGACILELCRAGAAELSR